MGALIGMFLFGTVAWLVAASRKSGSVSIETETETESDSKSTTKGRPVPGKAQRKLLRGMGEIMQLNLNWPGLADLLDTMALTESGWKLSPNKEVASSGSNRATGPYQLRPKSAGSAQPAAMASQFKQEPWLLEDPAIATSSIVAYFSRLSDNAPNATWGDVRASGAFPVYIHGRPTRLIEGLAKATKHKTLAMQQARYDEAIGRFKKGLKRAGVDASFADRKAFPRRMNYKVATLMPMLGFPSLPVLGSTDANWQRVPPEQS